MKFIFLGPPGAGKGTLAAVVSMRYGVPHISTGVIFREAIKAKNPLGIKVKAIIDSGSLVSDELTIELVESRLSKKDVSNGFILDGFPRTLAQAEGLCGISDIDAVVNFTISDDDVIKRLSGRRVCKNCGQNYHIDFIKPKIDGTCDVCSGDLYIRDDDMPDAIKNRLVVYKKQTEPLIAFYEQKDLLVTVDASPLTEKIVEEFVTIFPVQ